MELRPFQEAMIEDARAKLRRHKSVLVQLPTGGGKTVLAAFMIKTARERGLRAWFICHRDFLVEQTSKTLYSLAIDHRIVAAGMAFNPAHPMQICAIDTLKNRLDKLTPPDLIIWDECHHLGAAGWLKVRAWANGARHVGLSATPSRLDGKGLDDAFDDIVLGPSVSWLIENKYLAGYQAFAPNEVDLSGLRKRAGDFAGADLEKLMDTKKLVGDMVGHYRKLAAGRRAVYFCASVAHSKHVAHAFSEAGIPALHLDGSNSSAERRAAARSFARGELSVLTNVALFGEGYDLAAQAGLPVQINAVGLARPTASLALHLQQIGRALRPSSEFDRAVILDHAGNLLAHGLPDDDREWTLKGTEKEDSGALPPTVRCDSCFAVYKIPARKCPHCGFVRPVPASALQASVEVVDGELEEIDAVARKRELKRQEHTCKNVAELADLGRERGYKSPEQWAARIWSFRQQRSQSRAEEQARQHRLW